MTDLIVHPSAIAHPMGIFPFGNIFQFKPTDIHRALDRWAYQYGYIYRINLFTKKVFVLNDPADMKKVLLERPKNYRRMSSLGDAINEMGALGLFSVEGETWKRHKKLLTPAFSLNHSRDYLPGLVKMARRLERVLENKKRSGEVVDFTSLITKFTVDVTTDFAFGHDGNCLENSSEELQSHLNFLFATMGRRVQIPWAYWHYFQLPTDRKAMRSMDFVAKFLDKYIADAKGRLKSGATPRTILDSMIMAGETEGVSFSNEELRGNVMTLMLAGEDTTATTLAWTIYYLASNPEYITRLREEFSLLGELEDITVTQLDNLTLANSVLNEAMRLKPVAPIFFMQNNLPVQLAGTDWETDTTFVLNFFHVYNSPKYFNRPEQFLPERWPTMDESVHHDYFWPFGYGPRTCIGRHLSLLEMKMALITIIRASNVELCCPKEAVQERFHFTLMPNQCPIKFN
jgi:cytochrome P450